MIYLLIIVGGVLFAFGVLVGALLAKRDCERMHWQPWPDPTPLRHSHRRSWEDAA